MISVKILYFNYNAIVHKSKYQNSIKYHIDFLHILVYNYYTRKHL